MANSELLPERKSVERLAFEFWLRTGRHLTTAAEFLEAERKFNPYHDPQNGEFTFGPSASVRHPNQGSTDNRIPKRATTIGGSSTQTQRDKAPKPVKRDHLRAIMPSAGSRTG